MDRLRTMRSQFHGLFVLWQDSTGPLALGGQPGQRLRLHSR
jgi:hypothetical protein